MGAGTRGELPVGRLAAFLPIVAVSVVLLAGCGGAAPADTAPVPLAEGTVGEQPWRLEGLRQAGLPCTLLFLGGSDQATNARCGVRRTPLRHLDPVVLGVGTRLLVFSPLPAGARRVRVDGADGSIRVEPARVAAGFPGRFFVVDLPTDSQPTQVQAFADGGRAVVT